MTILVHFIGGFSTEVENVESVEIVSKAEYFTLRLNGIDGPRAEFNCAQLVGWEEVST